MAQRMQVSYVDDIDGRTADVTVEFALDGKLYQIDLNQSNADLLHAVLEPYIAAARRVTRGRRRAPSVSSAPAVSSAPRRGREELTQMREWLRTNGYEIKDRGRVPGELEQAYATKTPARANGAPAAAQFQSATA